VTIKTSTTTLHEARELGLAVYGAEAVLAT
jgi:hypothetical protein